MKLVTFPDKILNQVTTRVELIDHSVKGLVDEMIAVMRTQDGVGLAAPQVNSNLRIAVLDDRLIDGFAQNPIIMINPEIIRYSNKKNDFHREGCLSLPDKEFTIIRPMFPVVRYQGLDGRYQTTAFRGWAGVCVQHEIDHLEGILICDKVDDIFATHRDTSKETTKL